jgi:steroid delta-isomerase-like uncharacterized protein
MSAEANATTARRILDEAWNAGNIEVLDELCAPDCIEHDLSMHEEVIGLEANKERIRGYREAMPDVHVTIDDLVASGDRVVTRWHASGTNDGELMGNPPTHRSIEITGMSIDRFDSGGRLAETWDQWDNLSFMQQLGLAPSMEAQQA